ncbi:MAG: glutamate-1-semialdehyde 2,1-aminomutase [Planctomycetes bacterium]|nr:glutamate-1-semialdehyde 2,1-aminomutase [Planctomycetota bacterium]
MARRAARRAREPARHAPRRRRHPDHLPRARGAPRRLAVSDTRLDLDLTRSAEWFERAKRVLPGGVSSPVRAFGAVGGVPPVIREARGAHTTDVDGNTYLDFVGSWGPLILGHAHPDVVRAITEAAARGTTYGAPTPGEVQLAERLTGMLPHLEQVRFVSSGTEATMSAIRLARGATRRELLVKFAGCYHGHADHLLVAAGSGLVTFGKPSSAGVPAAFTEKTLVLDLDDEAQLERVFAERGHEIAAVIVEPIPANNGLLVQRPEWHARLRELTAQHGAVLIFDEVINGFRVAAGGAAELLGITPDLATYGKIIGGGLPVGAFGGRADLMGELAPLGGVYQAGTLSGNPVAMAAGLATLDVLEREDAWTRLEALGARLQERLTPLLAAAAEPVELVRVGSIFWLSLQAGPAPRRADAIAATAAERYRGLFHGLLQRGLSIAPSAYEVGFLSLAHEPAHVDTLVDALGELLA